MQPHQSQYHLVIISASAQKPQSQRSHGVRKHLLFMQSGEEKLANQKSQTQAE